MQITEEFFKKNLVDSGLISQKDFNEAKKEAQEKKESLEEIIVSRGLISDEELGNLIADAISFPFINLRKVGIKKETLEIIPEVVAREKEAICFDKVKEGIKIALSRPDDLEFREFIERKTGLNVIPYFATKRDILGVLKHYRRDIKGEFEEILAKALEELKKTTKGEPLPIIKMVDLILNYGYENRASDIHIEPYREKTLIRYRIDGILHDFLTLPKIIHDFLISRIKILSKLRTDIHEAAQDGHFSFGAADEKIDVRVSVVPIEEGEKVVLRILSEKSRKFELKDLGLEIEEIDIIKENIQKSWGMILISGPTGCGKTTTLYALLKILNTREINICTIEDPIEYDIEGINQIQVNIKTGLNFSKGLRAIMRQDPNVIMVGEIRDEETAKLATNAAMTGHLVLSTFHATDISTTLPRLLEMGIDAFLVTTTLNLIIAQRLVRKICPKCIESYELPFSKVVNLLGGEAASKLPKTKKEQVRLFRGRGCSLCQDTGYLGRTGIFEILEIKESIKELIMRKVNADQIKAETKKLGIKTMIEDGLRKMEKGITTLEEVLRATKE